MATTPVPPKTTLNAWAVGDAAPTEAAPTAPKADPQPAPNAIKPEDLKAVVDTFESARFEAFLQRDGIAKNGDAVILGMVGGMAGLLTAVGTGVATGGLGLIPLAIWGVSAASAASTPIAQGFKHLSLKKSKEAGGQGAALIYPEELGRVLEIQESPETSRMEKIVIASYGARRAGNAAESFTENAKLMVNTNYQVMVEELKPTDEELVHAEAIADIMWELEQGNRENLAPIANAFERLSPELREQVKPLLKDFKAPQVLWNVIAKKAPSASEQNSTPNEDR
jgi:hypothetical protein